MAIAMDELEKIITIQVAQKLLENISEENKKEILEKSLVNTLNSVLSAYNVEHAIKNDVKKYMVEYIQNADVQSRIKTATFESMDKLMNGVINTIIIDSQQGIKNEYKNFIKKEDLNK